MKKFLRGFLPNLTIALNAALLIVFYLENRNPMMGFMVGAPFQVLAIFACCCSIATAIVLYGVWRKPKKKHKKAQEEKVENNT